MSANVSSGFAALVASMSHDLRAPLNTIMGFSELMRSGRAGEIADEHREYLEDILTSARLLLRLLNDVIDIAKAEVGRLEFFPETIDLAQIAADVVSVAADQAAQRSITLRFDVDPALNGVTIDPDKLKQLLQIYVATLLAGAPSGAVISVRARPEGASAFRVDVERDGGGVGLDDVSLLLARRIVELQGGRAGTGSDERTSRLFAILPRMAQHAHA